MRASLPGLGEPEPTIKLGGVVLVQRPEKDGDASRLSTFDGRTDHRGADAEALKRRIDVDLPYVDVVSSIFDADISARHAVVFDHFEAAARPVVVEKPILLRLIPEPNCRSTTSRTAAWCTARAQAVSASVAGRSLMRSSTETRSRIRKTGPHRFLPPTVGTGISTVTVGAPARQVLQRGRGDGARTGSGNTHSDLREPPTHPARRPTLSLDL